MRQVHPTIFIGNVRDASDPALRRVHAIEALIEVAVEEPPARVPRELIHIRCPVDDGPGASLTVLTTALTAVVHLLVAETITLVTCSNGMSRSPCVAAAAIGVHESRDPVDVLASITRGEAGDVNPHFWASVRRAVQGLGR